MNPKVSICIPTYNGSTYLAECLDSVLVQSFEDFEVVLCDDRSTDNTLQIVNDYAKKDGRIRLHQNKENLGLVGNWNHCIELASGEWIKILFQDDLLNPGCLAKMLEAAEDNPSIPFICCKRHLLIEENVEEKTKMAFINVPTFEKVLNKKGKIFPEDICFAAFGRPGVNFIGEPTLTLIQRSAFKKYGFFNSDLIQLCDFEYWLRVASNAGMVYVPEELASFRLHGISTTSVNRSRDSFRMGELETLILFHELRNRPYFENFRSIIKEKYSLRNIEEVLLVLVRRARIKALKSGNRRKALKKLLDDFSDLKKYGKWYFLHPDFITELRDYTARVVLKKWILK